MSEQASLWPRVAGDGPAEADEIIAKAAEKYDPVATLLLVSGGNDSLVLLDTCAHRADAIVHINTGIGIEQTNEFAREVGASYGKPFIELRPPRTYEDIVFNVFGGMPGPGIHGWVYQRLKERCVREIVAAHKRRWRDRVLILTGVRRAESRRRMGYDNPVDRAGAQVWVNPLLWWTNDEMRDYRAERELPVNEVAANLHLSGECLCGAMADQNTHREERAALRFFYPAFDARLTEIERECSRRGLRYCEWGVKRPEQGGKAGPLCQSCEGRQLSLLGDDA